MNWSVSSRVSNDLPAVHGASPRDMLVGQIAEIFALALQLDRITHDGDFFELGGDSMIAATVAIELQKLTGRPVSSILLYDAPTPVALAERLLVPDEASTAAERLVLLRPGSMPPLFITHGLEGTAVEYRQFSNSLSIRQAIYVIEASRRTPLSRIEELAASHIEEMRRVQPTGPYLLAGHCFGGLVAMEIAQQLQAAGDEVALLALVDTHPHTAYWPPGYRLVAWYRLARAHLSFDTWSSVGRHLIRQFTERAPAARFAYLAKLPSRTAQLPFSIFQLSVMLYRFKGRSGVAMPSSHRMRPAELQQIYDANKAAFGAYRPRYYEGHLVLIQTMARKRVQFDGPAIWGSLARRFSHNTVAVEGTVNSLGLMEHCVPKLSMHVRHAVEELTSGGRAAGPEPMYRPSRSERLDASVTGHLVS